MEDAGLGIKGAAALKNTSVQQPLFLFQILKRDSVSESENPLNKSLQIDMVEIGKLL